jgi:rhamnose transport system substrate-binding protein
MLTSSSLAPARPSAKAPLHARLFPNGEWALLIVLACECTFFGLTAGNFLTLANAFEIVRLSVELGLLALALTPIIITGGIDLSVGSAMGLCAVVLGSQWRDHHVPMIAAVVITLVVSCGCGLLNALLIAGLDLPSLIVTLGTFSLYRGIAEGLTHGIENYSGFGTRFLFLGQGYMAGILPPQLLILFAAALAAAWALHRTPFGRTLYAIGFSPEGARFAAVPVRRRLAIIYIVSGLAAGVAAVIYVAHLGQAKSDAGTGYELSAITAVVLGGASIFGGRGTVLGTLLGLYALVVLQNGLRLSAMPAELTGVLTGVLLLGTVIINGLQRWKRPHKQETEAIPDEEFKVKNWQVAVLCAVMLGSACIVASSNWILLRSLRQQLQHLGGSTSQTQASPQRRKLTIGMMPKAKGDPYFISCKKGAEAAAQELGDDLIWDGPTDLDPAKQNEVVEAWITRGVDAIAVSVENKQAISTVLRKARSRGIRVIAWDADAEPDARDFFINQATPQGIGYTLTDEAARILDGRGDFAIITASLTAANQNEWIKYIKERLAAKYPSMKLTAIQPSEGDRDRAFAETQNVLKVYPNVKLVMAIAAPAVPGAAEAVKQSGRKDVKVIGLSLPNMCKPYIKDGTVESIVLWNTGNLGYLTVHAAHALVTGNLKRGDHDFRAGRLGTIEVVNDQVMLGKPLIFNKANIDQFDF